MRIITHGELKQDGFLFNQVCDRVGIINFCFSKRSLSGENHITTSVQEISLKAAIRILNKINEHISKKEFHQHKQNGKWE